jgi:hypothetical protein
VLLGLLALTLVALALALPTALQAGRKLRDKAAARRRERRVESGLSPGDPGRERRAEQRARELLRSCVNDEEWAMYRDLGFIRVHGHRADSTPGSGYAYLVYPNKPVVAFVPGSGRILNEYCVEFPDMTPAVGHSRLPASDDVLAKWMALTGDEERLIRSANMHLPGRQVDPARVRRDLWRLTEWERQRARSQTQDSQTQ